MGDPLGVGVVGAGAIGIRCALTHLSMDDVQDRVRLAAVCDPASGRAEAAAAKFGVPAHYLTYEELLADPGVDVVTIGSPIGLHFEQGMMAVDAGKHAHFNKTMTTTVDEADRLIEHARAKGVHIVASPGMMLMPVSRRVRKRVLDGSLGRVVWAAAGASGAGNYHMNEEFRKGDDVLTDVNPAWYFKKPGGGPQYDVTVYCMHNLTGILGPAKRVTAVSGLVVPEREYRGERIACEMDDSTFLLLDFGEALFAFVYGTVAGSVTRGFHPSIYGTKASVVGTCLGDEELAKQGDHQPHVTGPHADARESHVFEDIMQLADLVRDGTPTVASPEHARHVIDIIESGYRSAETGQAQELRTTFTPLAAEEL
ncbi:MAG: Gfo/Idh/MocA family protein [Planctomycetota bacterium]|jgi:predicted dehydrogenase